MAGTLPANHALRHPAVQGPPSIFPPCPPLPDAIDLGTVVNGKKIKWATFNVGASKESEFGDYYAWGDVDTYYTSQEPLSWKAGKEAVFDWPSYRFDNSAYVSSTTDGAVSKGDFLRCFGLSVRPVCTE